jgi:hypothetical protein
MNEGAVSPDVRSSAFPFAGMNESMIDAMELIVQQITGLAIPGRKISGILVIWLPVGVSCHPYRLTAHAHGIKEERRFS